MKKIDMQFFSMTSQERIEQNNILIDFLFPVMNKIHGKNFSKRFWMILLAPYVTVINSRKQILMSDKKLIIKPEREPINTMHLPTFKERFVIRLKYYFKGLKTVGFEKKIRSKLKEAEQLSMGFHDPASVKEDIPCYLETYYPIYLFPKKNKQKRILANQLASTSETIFEENVIKQLPKYLVEYFDYYYDKIKLFNPSLKTFNISIIETIYLRFLLAKYLEYGAKLHYYQHGAFYGEYQNYSPYDWEYQIADKYFTWGWRIHEKNVPWKAYRLYKFARSYRLFNKTNEFDCLIVFPQINSQNLASFRESTSNLINQLDKNKYRNILIRPRPTAVDLKYDAQFNFITDSRVIIDQGKKPIGSLISKSRIVIQYSYPSTNFLECLFVDHPSVGILKNRQPTEIVKPFYEFFLEKGVFHYDLQSVANQLNKINIEDWWSNIISDPVYQSFKETFLRC